MKNNLFLIALAIISVAAGVWFGTQNAKKDNPYASIGGDFTLESVNGPVSLSDFKDKVALVYFGYTACPDVCITSLTNVGAAMKLLSKEEQAQVQPIFVTVDPERDTAARVDEYARFFHPSILGVTGTAEAIAEIAGRYMVIYEKVQMADSAMGYSMDHSSRIYVINGDGEISALISHGETPENTVAYIREALE